MATTGASARLGLDAPADGTTEQVQQGDNLFRAWRLALEARAAMYQVGVVASRPAAAAGNAGTVYTATDTGVSYLSTGTVWRVMGGYVGQLSFSAANFAPDGFLVCTGQPVTTANVELRDWLIARGSPHGSSGANPLLPNTPGRVPVAAGSGSGLTARTVGQTFGVESRVPTLLAHAHVLRQQTGIGGGIAIDVAGQAGRVSTGGADSIAGGTGTDLTTESAGNSAAMSVEQPSVVMTLLIQAR